MGEDCILIFDDYCLACIDGNRYTGFASTTFRDVSYSVSYFSVYEPLKQLLKPYFDPPPDPSSSSPSFSPLPVILSGGTSGAIAWTAALPFDCAKTLIQQPPGNDEKISAVKVVKEYYAQNGLRGFYNGWVPTILRAFAVSGVRFLVYESTVHFLSNFWEQRRPT